MEYGYKCVCSNITKPDEYLDGIRHDACAQESAKRTHNNECGICGEKLGQYNNGYHPGCKNRQPTGYPGAKPKGWFLVEKCKYCRKDVNQGEYLIIKNEHIVCSTIESERYEAGICQACGIESFKTITYYDEYDDGYDPDDGWCGSCNRTYQNYDVPTTYVAIAYKDGKPVSNQLIHAYGISDAEKQVKTAGEKIILHMLFPTKTI